MRKINELSKHNNQAFENDSDLISIPLREKQLKVNHIIGNQVFPSTKFNFFGKKKTIKKNMVTSVIEFAFATHVV